MYVCIQACLDVWMYACMDVCMHVCMYTCMYACMHVCVYACVYECMHVCIFACMHACMHRPIDRPIDRSTDRPAPPLWQRSGTAALTWACRKRFGLGSRASGVKAILFDANFDYHVFLFFLTWHIPAHGWRMVGAWLAHGLPAQFLQGNYAFYCTHRFFMLLVLMYMYCFLSKRIPVRLCYW